MKKRILTVLAILTVFIIGRFFYGGNPNNVEPVDDFTILAHRGMHTNWNSTQYDLATGCEARHIYPPAHEYIENTIPAIQAAFDAGADMVEIDIRPSKDGVLMINHEENLECKTDGQGKIYEHTLAELQQLDVGYGFTHDDGETYPFRGKGVRMMPTLEEVLAAFPDKQFLIDHKDRQRETAELLVEVLKQLPPERQQLIKYWGSREIGDYIASELPLVERLLANRAEMKQCIVTYVLSLGLLGFGQECQGLTMGMSREYARYFPGWPYGFINQAHQNGSRVYLMIDTQEDVDWARSIPADGIITDYIEIIGPEFSGAN